MSAQTTEKEPVTFEQAAAMPIGAIFVDRHEDGFRFLVMRGPAAVVAYLGVPESHPLAGRSYEDLPLECHGGLTFSALGGHGKRDQFPAGWWWYGWDYAHSGDKSFYDLKYPEGLGHLAEKAWTPAEVDADSWTARYEFKKLMRLAEAIASGPQGTRDP